MSLDIVNTAIKVLSIWYGSWEEHCVRERPMFRRFALRQKAIGIVNHDRVLLGRRLFTPTIKTKF